MIELFSKNIRGRNFFLRNRNNLSIRKSLIDTTLGREYTTKVHSKTQVDNHMILPVGTEDFGKLINKKLDFVDKTLFVKEILDDVGADVVVITRPRRFGKTLNLSMLNYFLAEKVNGQSTKGLFDNLSISRCGDEYLQHQAKYPVISVTFKDIKELTYDSAKLHLSKVLSVLYSEHIELLSSQKLTSQDKRDFERILEKNGTEIDIKSSLEDLTRYIYLHYRVKPWLLIDEYDTPIQAAYVNKYYNEMIELMRGVLSSSLKSNSYLEKAVITGILRVAKESLFSGVNNLKVYSILNPKYGEYFGFTETEVADLLKKSNFSDKSEDIKNWYNGYQIGNNVIYNPWSITNCISEKCILQPYWVNTSDNQLIKDLLKASPIEFKKELELLLKGDSIEGFIDENMVFQYMSNDPGSVWSLLLMSGYLKPVSTRYTDQGTVCQLAIPNKEVRNLYRQIVEQWLSNGHGLKWYNDFIDTLLVGNIEKFKKHLEKVIFQITSYHDFAREPEAFYHGLMLGFTVSLHSTGAYEIKSNRESGKCRFDIMLIPKNKSKLGIIIELKSIPEKEDLLKSSKDAVKQIDDKKYTEEFKGRGINDIIKIGIAFRQKDFEVHSVREGTEQQVNSSSHHPKTY